MGRWKVEVGMEVFYYKPGCCFVSPVQNKADLYHVQGK